jgi:hypothetical protein
MSFNYVNPDGNAAPTLTIFGILQQRKELIGSLQYDRLVAKTRER